MTVPIRVPVGRMPGRANPLESRDGYSRRVSRLLHSNLCECRRAPKNCPTLRAASTYMLTHDVDLHWSDGKRVRADDVIAAWSANGASWDALREGLRISAEGYSLHFEWVAPSALGDVYSLLHSHSWAVWDPKEGADIPGRSAGKFLLHEVRDEGPQLARNSWNCEVPPDAPHLAFVWCSVGDQLEAYRAGAIDLVDDIADECVVPESMSLVSSSCRVLRSLTIPQWDGRFSGEAGKLRRRALSLAIDRGQVAQATGHRMADSASNLLSYYGGQQSGGEHWRSVFDPGSAARLWDAAQVLAGDPGEVSLWFNADGGHENWCREVVSQWRDVFGGAFVARRVDSFKDLRGMMARRDAGGLYRSGWRPGEFLTVDDVAEHFNSMGGHNLFGYKFSERVMGIEELVELRFPVIPVWHSVVTLGHRLGLRVQPDWDGLARYDQIEFV